MAQPNPEFKRGSCFDGGVQQNMRLWGDAEYLLWWSRGAPLPVALITTGDLADSVPAALDQPHTRVLFGKKPIEVKMQSGFRLALRSWFGDKNSYAIEGSGFYLPKLSERNFSKSSEKSTGLPILGVPFSNATTQALPLTTEGWSSIANSGETALLAANGTTLFGKISVYSSSKLWDIELNGLWHFWGEKKARLSALAGVLYTDLSEGLDLYYFTQQILFPEAIFRPTSIADHFSTHNQFYGGQLGIRGEWSENWFFFNFIGKLAIGDMVESVRVDGEFS
jgi:hypothetical protein